MLVIMHSVHPGLLCITRNHRWTKRLDNGYGEEKFRNKRWIRDENKKRERDLKKV